MIEAALLQRETLEEVRRDPHATGRSIVVVFAAAISAGIGAAIAGGLVEGVARVIATTLGWIVCAVTVSVIGRRLFGADESFASREFQTVGLASAPALLLVVGAVPVFGPLFVMGVLGWLLATMTMATRVSLGLDLESSALTAGAGWLLFFAIAVVAPTLFA